MDEESNTLSIAGVAKEFGVTSGTIHNWRRRGWITASQLPNGRYVIAKDHVRQIKEQAIRNRK